MNKAIQSALSCANSAFFVAVLFATAPLHAQEINRLYRSHEVRQLKASISRDPLYGPKWLAPDSELAALFTHKSGHEYLAEWLGLNAITLPSTRTVNISTREIKAISREYTTAQLRKFTVKIFVPHPKFAESMKLGLLEPFASLIPPKLKISSKRPITIGSQEGTLYQNELGYCSIILHTARSAAFVISSDTCATRPDMEQAIQKLDWNEFNRKLAR